MEDEYPDFQNVHYISSGDIHAEIDGMSYTIPDNMENRYRQLLALWEAAGGVIQPYTPPEE